MIQVLGLHEATALFQQLPKELRLPTLSPAYAEADAIRDDAIAPLYVVYREVDRFWLHSLHHGVVANTGLSDLQAPYGYGGPLANCESRDFLTRAWTAWTRWCQSEGVLAEFVRFHPLAANWRYYGGSIRFDRQTVVVPLHVSDLLIGYDARCRTAVRKAQKAEIEIAWLPPMEHAHAFAAFYREGMTAIGADPYYLFGDEYFVELSRLPGIGLLVCHRGGKWLSAGLFLQSAEVMEYHLSATTSEGRRLCATNLLLHVAAQSASESGCHSLYLGGGTDGSDDNPLLFFKSGFSAARAPFRVGYTIHRTEEYAELKTRQAILGRVSSRILFYR